MEEKCPQPTVGWEVFNLWGKSKGKFYMQFQCPVYRPVIVFEGRTNDQDKRKVMDDNREDLGEERENWSSSQLLLTCDPWRFSLRSRSSTGFPHTVHILRWSFICIYNFCVYCFRHWCRYCRVGYVYTYILKSHGFIHLSTSPPPILLKMSVTSGSPGSVFSVLSVPTSSSP